MSKGLAAPEMRYGSGTNSRSVSFVHAIRIKKTISDVPRTKKSPGKQKSAPLLECTQLGVGSGGSIASISYRHPASQAYTLILNSPNNYDD